MVQQRVLLALLVGLFLAAAAAAAAPSAAGLRPFTGRGSAPTPLGPATASVAPAQTKMLQFRRNGTCLRMDGAVPIEAYYLEAGPLAANQVLTDMSCFVDTNPGATDCRCMDEGCGKLGKPACCPNWRPGQTLALADSTFYQGGDVEGWYCRWNKLKKGTGLVAVGVTYTLLTLPGQA